MQLQQGKQIAKSNLLRKCGLLAHTSAAFLKNCCTEKLFISPAAHILQPTSKKSSKNHSTNYNLFQHRNQTSLSTIPCFSPVDKFPEIAYNKERTHRTIVCKEVRQCCPLYTVKNRFRLPCPVWQAANGLHKVFYFMEMPD